MTVNVQVSDTNVAKLRESQLKSNVIDWNRQSLISCHYLELTNVRNHLKEIGAKFKFVQFTSKVVIETSLKYGMYSSEYSKAYQDGYSQYHLVLTRPRSMQLALIGDNISFVEEPGVITTNLGNAFSKQYRRFDYWIYYLETFYQGQTPNPYDFRSPKYSSRLNWLQQQVNPQMIALGFPEQNSHGGILPTQ